MTVLILEFNYLVLIIIISERLIMEMADRMAEDGFKDAGYEYVSIDVSFLYLHFNVYIHYIASL